MGQRGDAEPASPVPLSLAALLESLAAHIDRLHLGTSGLLLQAVLVESGSTGRVYGSFVYAQLRDLRTDDAIDARIPQGLAAELKWNREAVLVGLLRFKRGRGGVLKPEFRIDSTRSRLQLAQRGEERGMKAGQPLFPWRKWFSTGNRGNRIFLFSAELQGFLIGSHGSHRRRGVCSFLPPEETCQASGPSPGKKHRGGLRGGNRGNHQERPVFPAVSGKNRFPRFPVICLAQPVPMVTGLPSANCLQHALLGPPDGAPLLL
jgi:hypothetical protein